jgi:hypothetical protein
VTKEEAKSLFYSEYVSKHGLAWLSSGGPDSDNGILFLGMVLAKINKLKLFDKMDTFNAYQACESIQAGAGYIIRGPNNNLLEAHDNLIGACGVSVICEFDYARLIADRGNKYGFSYNSVNPEKQELRTTLQGGDICFIKMSAGYIPTIWEYIWMLVGMLLGGYKGSPSTVNICWYRTEILDLVFERKFSKLHWTFAPYQITKLIFRLLVKNRFGGIGGSYARYFPEGHPIHKMSELLNEQNKIFD